MRYLFWWPYIFLMQFNTFELADWRSFFFEVPIGKNFHENYKYLLLRLIIFSAFIVLA